MKQHLYGAAYIALIAAFITFVAVLTALSSGAD